MGLWNRRRLQPETDPADLTPDIDDWLAYDDSLRGGYVFTADPDAAPMTLTAPIVTRGTTFRVSVPPDELHAGQYYLLGGPEEPTCEVVRVETDAPEPDGSRRIRRVMFDTIGWNHPIGTLVTPVTVGRLPGLPPAVPRPTGPDS